MPTPPISNAGDDIQQDVDEHGFIGGFKMESDSWAENPVPYPAGYGTVPRGKPRMAPSTQRHGSSASSEFGSVKGKQNYSTAPRPGMGRPKPPVAQTIPSRTGRRPRAAGPEVAEGQDFGVSLERMRVGPTYS